MSPEPQSLPIQKSRELLAVARQLSSKTVEEASGQCLVSTLCVALSSHTPGELLLLRWEVAGDPSYREHWALRMDERTAIDATRMQVDRKRSVAVPLSAYPSNYRLAGEYRLSELLSGTQTRLAFARRRAKPPLEINFRTVASLRWRAACIDARGSRPTAPVFVAAMPAFLHFLGVAASTSLRRSLEGRRRKLEVRLGTPAQP